MKIAKSIDSVASILVDPCHSSQKSPRFACAIALFFGLLSFGTLPLFSLLWRKIRKAPENETINKIRKVVCPFFNQKKDQPETKITEQRETPPPSPISIKTTPPQNLCVALAAEPRPIESLKPHQNAPQQPKVLSLKLDDHQVKRFQHQILSETENDLWFPRHQNKIDSLEKYQALSLLIEDNELCEIPELLLDPTLKQGVDRLKEAIEANLKMSSGSLVRCIITLTDDLKTDETAQLLTLCQRLNRARRSLRNTENEKELSQELNEAVSEFCLAPDSRAAIDLIKKNSSETLSLVPHSIKGICSSVLDLIAIEEFLQENPVEEIKLSFALVHNKKGAPPFSVLDPVAIAATSEASPDFEFGPNFHIHCEEETEAPLFPVMWRFVQTLEEHVAKSSYTTCLKITQESDSSKDQLAIPSELADAYRLLDQFLKTYY